MSMAKSRLGWVRGILVATLAGAPVGCGDRAGEADKSAPAAASAYADNKEGGTGTRAREEMVVEGALDPREKAPAATAVAAADASKDSPGDLLQKGAGGPGLGGGGYGGDRGLGVGVKAARPSIERATNESKPAAPKALPSGYAPSAPVVTAPQPKKEVLTEAPIDPNGRFATTYRPGGGHLSAFESAVAAGLIPEGEREIVSDVGARYLPKLDAPAKGALAFTADFEREKLAPTGGAVHLRFSLRSTEAEAKERPHLSVVVVMDVSGSMRGKLISSAREAATQLVEKLDAGDDFSLVTFSTDAHVLVPMTKVGPKRDAIKKTISEISEGGGTNIGEGLTLGYGELKKVAGGDGVKVAMLLSDGRANEGVTNRGALAGMALGAFQDGVQTSAFGLGTDYDGPLMSQIANDGAGGYYYLRDPAQIPASLTTELEKRLDPVATAVEVRVRLKPEVELLNVYGSRRLNNDEAARIRTIEVTQDQQSEKRDKIKANRHEDTQGGMRFFIPAFARSDAHSILLKLRLPEGVGTRDVAQIEVKYKDRLLKKNVSEELPLKLAYADSDAESAKSIDRQVLRTVQAFAAGEALMKASRLVADRNTQQAIDLLGEREGLLEHAAATLGEPLFVEDARRLARLRLLMAGKTKLSDPLVLAMVSETAGSVHLH